MTAIVPPHPPSPSSLLPLPLRAVIVDVYPLLLRHFLLATLTIHPLKVYCCLLSALVIPQLSATHPCPLALVIVSDCCHCHLFMCCLLPLFVDCHSECRSVDETDAAANGIFIITALALLLLPPLQSAKDYHTKADASVESLSSLSAPSTLSRELDRQITAINVL